MRRGGGYSHGRAGQGMLIIVRVRATRPSQLRSPTFSMSGVSITRRLFPSQGHRSLPRSSYGRLVEAYVVDSVASCMPRMSDPRLLLPTKCAAARQPLLECGLTASDVNTSAVQSATGQMCVAGRPWTGHPFSPPSLTLWAPLYFRLQAWFIPPCCHRFWALARRDWHVSE